MIDQPVSKTPPSQSRTNTRCFCNPFLAILVHAVFCLSGAVDNTEDEVGWQGAPFRRTSSSGYPGRLERRRDELQVVDDLVYNHWLIYSPSGRCAVATLSPPTYPSTQSHLPVARSLCPHLTASHPCQQGPRCGLPVLAHPRRRTAAPAPPPLRLPRRRPRRHRTRPLTSKPCPFG